MTSKTQPIIALVLFAVLAIPVGLAAQHTRFKIVDIGTFGGPNDIVNGPNVPIISSNGRYGGSAETSIPDPYAPDFCQDGDCLVLHAQRWSNGVMTDLGTLPGVNLSSGATWTSANATIVGSSENGLIDRRFVLSSGRTTARSSIWERWREGTRALRLLSMTVSRSLVFRSIPSPIPFPCFPARSPTARANRISPKRADFYGSTE